MIRRDNAGCALIKGWKVMQQENTRRLDEGVVNKRGELQREDLTKEKKDLKRKKNENEVWFLLWRFWD